MGSAQEEIEGRDSSSKPTGMPPAGPHARRELTDNEKTPGAGSLVDENAKGGEADVGSD